MYETPRCFKCGEEGHIKRECPQRTPAAKTPDVAPSADGDEKGKPLRVPPRRPPEEIADSHMWAERIRAADPRMGRPQCGDQGDAYDSEFRRMIGLHPVHECELRQLAAEQGAERTAA